MSPFPKHPSPCLRPTRLCWFHHSKTVLQYPCFTNAIRTAVRLLQHAKQTHLWILYLLVKTSEGTERIDKGPGAEILLLSLSDQNRVHCLRLFKELIKKNKKRKVKMLELCSEQLQVTISYLSMITGSDGVSFRFPQLFLSQHRLKKINKTTFIYLWINE